MKKTNYLFLVLITVLMVACSSEDELATNENGGWEDIQPKTIGDGKYQALGYGYDITGEYLAHESIKRQVINVEAFVSQNKADYDDPYIGEITTKMYGGEDYFSYMKDIQKESGFEGTLSYGKKEDAINASFSGNYNKKNGSRYEYSSKYSFARGDIVKRLNQHVVYANASELSKYLSSNFKRDLATLSANEIVEAYGTHVLTDIEVGGMFTAIFKSVLVEESNTTSKTKAVKGGLSLNYKKIGLSLGNSSSITETEAYAYKNTDWSFEMRSVGGSTNGYSISFTSKDPNPNQTIDLGQWAGTVDKTHCVLVGVNWKTAYPIYEFIADPVKKAQIKVAVENYIKSKQVKTLKVKPMYALHADKWKDRYYEFDKSFVDSQIKQYGDSYWGIVGYVLEEPEAGKTKPLHNMFSDSWKDRYFVYSEADRDSQVKQGDGYSGISGYIYNNQYNIDMLPVYEMYSPSWKDRYYVFSLSEAMSQTQHKDQIVGLVGYIYKP